MIKGIVVGFSFVVALTSNIYSEKIDTFWKEEIKGICTSCVYEHPKEEEHRYADYYDDIDYSYPTNTSKYRHITNDYCWCESTH